MKHFDSHRGLCGSEENKNVCEPSKNGATRQFWVGATSGRIRKKGRELSEFNTKAFSRGQNQLIGEFKMAVVMQLVLRLGYEIGDILCEKG